MDQLKKNLKVSKVELQKKKKRNRKYIHPYYRDYVDTVIEIDEALTLQT